MSDEWERVDTIAKHLSALARELDGYGETGGNWVGNAYVKQGRREVNGQYWEALRFQVRDDRSKRWEFTVAISPAGRTARVFIPDDYESQVTVS